MGIFEFIKNLFQVDELGDEELGNNGKQEKQRRSKEVSKSDENEQNKINITDIVEIKKILDKKFEDSKSKFHDVKDKMHLEFSPIVEKLERDLEILSDVDISKKKGEDRLKQANETGREEYINNVNRLIDFLEDKDNGVLEISDKLENFFKVSAKSYARTTILIGKEMESIVNDISNIKKVVDKFGESNKNLSNKERKIKEMLDKYDEKILNERRKSEMMEEIDEIKENSSNNEIRKEEIEKNIDDIKDSGDYLERARLIGDIERKESELKSIKSNVESLIDERIFRKYIYLEKDSENARVANSYLENSIEGIFKDDKLEILRIFGDIVDKIRDDKINVKGSDKIMDKLSTSKDEFLENRENIVRIKDEIEELDKRIGELDSSIPNLDEINKERVKINEQISKGGNDLLVLKNRLEKMEDKISELESELVSWVNS